MIKHTLVIASAVACSLFSFTTFAKPMGANQSQAGATVVQAENVEWGYLNPLRGDKSPGAANLWGDRTKDTATGMLVKFKKGFSSPPHIHNITYRGVVIEGLLHNDDPTAANMWMPKGSYWTQPAGEEHITAANGDSNLIYLEIDSGPYLVKPSKAAFDNGEAPINVHANNLVWQPVGDAQRTYLWGSAVAGELGGSLIKLPADFQGNLVSTGSEFRAVVISGQVKYTSTATNKADSTVKVLNTGSYVSSSAHYRHQVATTAETVLYIRTNGDIIVNKG